MIGIDRVGVPGLLTPGVEQPPVVAHVPDTLEPGSVLARAVYEVLTGRRAVVIPSPPGAGKTTLVVDVIERVVAHSELSICVLTPTNQGGGNIANLIYEAINADRPKSTTPRGVAVSKNMQAMVVFSPQSNARVSVATVASANAAKSPTVVDLTIVDEAYQTPLADILQAVATSRQVLLVGDPGQIGPVITADTSPWSHLGNLGPHSPAPHSFAARDDATVLTLDKSFRLGSATVDVIAPLYDFPFESARPDCHLEDSDGNRFPEIARVAVADPAVPHDLAAMRVAVERALSFIGATFVKGGVSRPVTGRDIAIVVSHNAQSAAIAAQLAGSASRYGIDSADVTVGTADSLQGGQWLAVVSVDPLLGHPQGSPHSQAPGRLCVMLSRHIAHLTWVYGHGWKDALAEQDDTNNAERRIGVKVRRRLLRSAQNLTAQVGKE